MDWAALITALIKIVAGVSDFLARQQLLDAGKAEAVATGLTETLAALEKHDAVKKELADNPDGEYARSLRSKYERPDGPN